MEFYMECCDKEASDRYQEMMITIETNLYYVCFRF
jgi:hypothetical protein